MNETLKNLMREATRLTQTGRLGEATAAIRRALGGAAPTEAPRPAGAQANARAGAGAGAGASAGAGAGASAGAGAGASVGAPASSDVLDGCVFEVGTRTADPAPAFESPPSATPAAPPADARRAAPQGGAGTFTPGTHTHAALSRDYKLYAPPGAAGRSLPLVVMLHGCTQDPDDFAAGTAMNELAAAQGLFVLYPAQAQSANPQRCWNWFKPNHQRRGSGEPALLASLTQAVIAQHGIDPARVYIAGLSAGGAMAAIVAAAYPEVFAAAGVHSGLPAGAAGNVAEALVVMGSGAAGAGSHRGAGRAGAAPAPVSAAVRTIVFHGDQDRTVHPRNGDQVVVAALHGALSRPTVEQGASASGQRFTRAVHRSDDGSVRAEHWRIHGAGHAWSGGRAAGSYTDANGPDATREMLRFFLDDPHRPAG